MKCRQIHLGCPLNLFVGAEWLPSDRSSLSLKNLTHGNSGDLEIYGRLYVEVGTKAGNQGKILKKADQSVMKNLFFKEPKIDILGNKRVTVIHACRFNCQRTKSSFYSTGIFCVCTNPRDNICSGTTAFSSR